MRGEVECVDWLEDEESADAPNPKTDVLLNIPFEMERGELRLAVWRNYLPKYRRKLRMVEDWNKLSEIWHLLKDALRTFWKKKVEDGEKKRAKRRVAGKIIYGAENNVHLQECFSQNIGAPGGMISMHQSLYVEAFWQGPGQRLLRLHNQVWLKNEPLLRLREIPARIRPESIMQYILVELKLNKKNEAGLKDGYDQKDDYQNTGHADRRHQERQHQEMCGDIDLTNEDNNDVDIHVKTNDQAEYHFFAFVAENTKSFPNNRSKWGRTPLGAGKPRRRVGDPLLGLREYMKKYNGCWMCYGKGNSQQHDHKNCAVYAADKKEYFKLHPERFLKEKWIQNWKDHQSRQDGGGRGKHGHVRQIGDVAESLLHAGRQIQEMQAQ